MLSPESCPVCHSPHRADIDRLLQRHHPDYIIEWLIEQGYDVPATSSEMSQHRLHVPNQATTIVKRLEETGLKEIIANIELDLETVKTPDGRINVLRRNVVLCQFIQEHTAKRIMEILLDDKNFSKMPKALVALFVGLTKEVQTNLGALQRVLGEAPNKGRDSVARLLAYIADPANARRTAEFVGEVAGESGRPGGGDKQREVEASPTP